MVINLCNLSSNQERYNLLCRKKESKYDMRFATLYADNVTRLYTKMRYLIVLYLAIYELAKAEIDDDQNNYLLRRGIKCGIQPDTGSSSKSRIVNGKPSKRTKDRNIPYPWMAFVLTRVATENIENPTEEKTIRRRSGGVVITEKAVLTCGHCLCNDMKPDDEKNVKHMKRTCLKGPDANQNREKINEILTMVGEMEEDLDKMEIFPEYDADTQAFLYLYEPPNNDKWFSNNGDVGIIVKNNKLSLKNGEYNPICLPTPDVFKKDKELQVKLVGWGWRYESTNLLRKLFGQDDITNGEKNSCLTNGGRLIDDESKRFIPCKKEGSQKYYCWNVLTRTTPTHTSIRSFSTNTELEFAGEPSDAVESLKFPIIGQSLFIQLINDNDNKCGEYYDKAKECWIDYMILTRWKGTDDRSILGQLFDEEVQRIQIHKTHENDETVNGFYPGEVIETCYNLNAVGQNGICETAEEAPFNWGFCSTSCNYADLPTTLPWEPYHEAIFKYLDTAPENTFFSSNVNQDCTV